MIKPNKEKLLERINGMKFICADGRREIKELVAELIGEPLESQMESFSPGDIVSASGFQDMLVVKVRDKYGALSKADGFFSNEDCELMTYEERLQYYRSINGKVTGRAAIVVSQLK